MRWGKINIEFSISYNVASRKNTKTFSFKTMWIERNGKREKNMKRSGNSIENSRPQLNYTSNEQFMVFRQQYPSRHSKILTIINWKGTFAYKSFHCQKKLYTHKQIENEKVSKCIAQKQWQEFNEKRTSWWQNEQAIFRNYKTIKVNINITSRSSATTRKKLENRNRTIEPKSENDMLQRDCLALQARPTSFAYTYRGSQSET